MGSLVSSFCCSFWGSCLSCCQSGNDKCILKCTVRVAGDLSGVLAPILSTLDTGACPVGGAFITGDFTSFVSILASAGLVVVWRSLGAPTPSSRKTCESSFIYHYHTISTILFQANSSLSLARKLYKNGTKVSLINRKMHHFSLITDTNFIISHAIAYNFIK